eukprot:2624541-Pleurochrysis_carterae.AAC.1
MSELDTAMLQWRGLTACGARARYSSCDLRTACYSLGGCVGSRTLTTTCGKPRSPYGHGVEVGAEAPVVPGAYPILSERGICAVRGFREGQEGLV